MLRMNRIMFQLRFTLNEFKNSLLLSKFMSTDASYVKVS